MGLNTRAMGGIDLDAAYDVAGVTRDRLTSVCAITVGYRGTNDGIHPRMVKNDIANNRKDFQEITFKNKFVA